MIIYRMNIDFEYFDYNTVFHRFFGEEESPTRPKKLSFFPEKMSFPFIFIKFFFDLISV